MSDSVPILQYRDFWDVPRIFLAHFQGDLFLFDCPFDDETEDYPEIYKVYRMPPTDALDLTGSWYGLEGKALAFLGEVPITRVQFDETRRKALDAAVLKELTADARAG